MNSPKHIAVLKLLMVSLFLFGGISSVSAQEQTVILPSNQTTRQEAIREIEKQTKFKVGYSRSSFNDKVVVSLNNTSFKLNELLDRLLEQSGHTYRINTDYILIYKDGVSKEEPPQINTLCDVSGVVTDPAGTPQGEVLIELIDIVDKSTTTASDGRFSLSGIPSGDHIVRLTPSDGKPVRYRKITTPFGGHSNGVEIILSGEIQSFARQDEEPEPVVIEKPNPTYYYPVDTTQQALLNLPKQDFQSMVSVPAGSVYTGEYSPVAAVKTNFLWWATTSPNLSVEFALAPKWTLDISAVYNPFQQNEEALTRLGLIQPEARYWFCNRFEKHFVGLHAIYGRFNIGNTSIPFTNTFDENRYEGWGAGVGVSYGYHLPMGKRWGWEFTAGFGYLRLKYDKFRCGKCDEFLGNTSKSYFGPTKVGVSLLFMIR